MKVHDAVVRAERGDLVERVWREQGQKLWRSLAAFTGDPELASDAMAEAFAQALGRGDAVETPDRWIWRAAFRIASGELKIRSQTRPDVAFNAAASEVTPTRMSVGFPDCAHIGASTSASPMRRAHGSPT